MTAESIKTTCPYCGVGCGVLVEPPETQHGKIAPVQGDPQHPANYGRLCVKGRALSQTLDTDGRLLSPQIAGETVSWSTALQTISDKIRQVVADHGADAIAFYLSGQMLTEDYYVANKLAKGFIGTANVDTNSRLCMASAVAAYKRAFGSDTVPCNYEDLEQCDLLIMVGSNAAWTHPILYQRIEAAKKQRPHMKVVVIDPRVTATSTLADLHLAIKPGTDAALFAMLLVQSSELDSLDEHFINESTDDFELALNAAKQSVPTIQVAAELCAVAEADLVTLLEWWRTTPRAVTFYSQGVNQSSSGVDKCNAIINCHLATGRIGKLGTGPFSITGQPNAMGGREVGGLSNQLAAHMDFATPGAIERVQTFWQAPNMAQQNGLKAIDLFDAIAQNKIKVVWIMSTNPVVSLPDTLKVKQALSNCEMVIVSDCQAYTDTTVLADVLLPATGWSEKNGTVTNSERRISRQRGVLPAPGEAQHDWWAICEVAKRLGFQSAFSYQHPHEIFIEHAALSGFGNHGTRDFDISYLSTLNRDQYDQLRPIQWPVTANSPNGTARMFADGYFYTHNQRAKFIPIIPRPPVHQPESNHFILNTGRLRDQWHTMTRTGKAASLLQHTEQPYLDIHPKDAHDLAIEEGALVYVTSAQSRLVVKAKCSSSQQRKQVFMPIHWTNQFSNQPVVSSLIPSVVDPISGQPESKHAIVNIAAVPDVDYGFLLCRRPLEVNNVVYCCRVTQAQGYRYELALKKGSDYKSMVSSWLAVDIGLLDGEWIEYHNPITQSYRLAYFHQGNLWAVGYFAATPALPSRDWLAQLFGSQMPETVALDDSMRLALLMGKKANSIDKGKIVCTCFQVGEHQIRQALAQGFDSVEALGSHLKCGRNCGSCIPELKKILSQYCENVS